MATGSRELDTETLLNDLHKWVSAETLRKKNIEKYDLKVYGTDEKAEHYGSDIAIVDITAENFDGSKREYSLVIKYGQMRKSLRQKLPIRDGFEREIDIYTKIVPAYHKFQKEKNLPLFDSIPKCYLSKFTETEEVIILENLKCAGYDLHNRQIPLDLNHMKLVLQAYAEWHALSFALKDQKNDEYQQIKKSWRYNNPMKDFIRSEPGKLLNAGMEKLFDILKQNNEFELLEKYQRVTGNNDSVTILIDLLNVDEEQSVILHGDCWNSNFLFKYADDDKEKQNCLKVALLDFQLSSIKSPIFDISQFIYSVASEKELKQFNELMEFYYDYFSNYLIKLGSDPGKIFSYTSLMEHWKKYAIYGAVLNPMMLMFELVEKDKTPELDNENFRQILYKSTEKGEYKNRAISVAKHFLDFFD